MERKLIKEAQFQNSLLMQIEKIEDNMLIDLNRKCNEFNSVIESFKNNLERLTPQAVETLIGLGVEIGKSHMSLLNDIGISDIAKIEAIKLNLSTIRKSFNDLDLLANMLNKRRSDAKFAKNALNGDAVKKESNMPKRIKEADSLLEKIDSSLSSVISKLNEFNKTLQMMKFELGSLSISPNQPENEYLTDRLSV